MNIKHLEAWANKQLTPHGKSVTLFENTVSELAAIEFLAGNNKGYIHINKEEFNKLSLNEQKAILAHEMGHMFHGDKVGHDAELFADQKALELGTTNKDLIKVFTHLGNKYDFISDSDTHPALSVRIARLKGE